MTTTTQMSQDEQQCILMHAVSVAEARVERLERGLRDILRIKEEYGLGPVWHEMSVRVASDALDHERQEHE